MSELCEAIRVLSGFYPKPKEFADLRQALRQTQQAEAAVGAPVLRAEDAVVSAWFAVLEHEAHALHAALDTLRARYCEGSP